MNWKYIFVALSSVLALQTAVGQDPLLNITREAHEKFAEEFSLSAVLNAPTKNVIISPIVVEKQLSLVYAGASEAAASVLKNALHLERWADKKFALLNLEKFFNASVSELGNGVVAASGVYVHKNYLFSFKPEFEELATRLNISSHAVNFDEKGLIEINYDFMSKTKFQSGPILPQSLVNQSELLVLASELVFKTPWRVEFPVKRFSQIKFDSGKKNSNGSSTVLAMSIKEQLPYADLKEFDAKAVEVPFEKKNMRMLIILPNKRDGLADLEQKLRSHDMQNIRKQLKEKKVHLVLPKLHVEYNEDLKDTLIYMGFGHIFSDEAKFTDMFCFVVSEQSTPITNVQHKAALSIDFQGGPSSSSVFEKFKNVFRFATDVIVDHPFLFEIRTDDAIVLSGHIINVQQ